ncbi:hypothetical protein AMTRI_Chr13g118950 [Amborella trichopoda]
MDNCITNDFVVKKLKDNLSEKLLLEMNHFHIRCCAHILDIIVQAEMRVIHSTIKSVSETVKYLRVPSKKGLVLSVPTRWNSTFDMLLQSALTNKEVFARYADSHHYDSAPSSEDWNKIEIICKFLKVFKESINLFFRSKQPTSHIYFSEVWGIQDMFIKEGNNQDETITSITFVMQQIFVNNLRARDCIFLKS